MPFQAAETQSDGDQSLPKLQPSEHQSITNESTNGTAEVSPTESTSVYSVISEFQRNYRDPDPYGIISFIWSIID